MMKFLDIETTPLKRTMYYKNITQAELSRMTGIAYAQLNTYCNGKNTPGEKIRKVLAEALGVAIEEIFPE
ncbi:MAG: helix-turn-helix transcriptional regulator [Chlorobium sp.]|nr:helix-turn-helix transcriptional regulator [Chlorobium sp.]